MSINRIDRQPYINAYNSSAKKQVDKVNKKQEVDRIEISELGKSLKEYSSEINTDNSKRVEEIKNKLNNGTYNVDAKFTAKSLLDAMKGRTL